ncbi:MAG: hypothetical protein R6W48_12335 [Gaiellaceae bacterium]
MVIRATLVVVVAAATLLAPLSVAAPTVTPDQRLAAELQAATRASQAALRSLTQPTAPRSARAAEELRRALAAIDAARVVAPRAVGAFENRSMRAALQQGRALTRAAAYDVAKGRYGPARSKIGQANALRTTALRDFGRPLRKEFAATAVNRDFRNVPAFREHSGVTATASEEVVEIVIGRATRTTANAGEPTSGAFAQGLPIAALTAYQIQDPIGAYTTNWCSLAAGLITCPLRPTLVQRHSFTLAFSPKLTRGTQILVKFRAASGRSSYSVYTVR